MNRLDAMQMFLRVAELASFTKAADALGVPKASVSSAVQQLETELGTRLLQRTTRKVQLTQDGHAYYERCRDVLADMDELQSMFQQDGRSLRGRLRVDMPGGTARQLIIPELPQFLAQHPLIEIELSCTDRKVDVIREGFDCVLRIGSIADPNLIARQLGSFRMINCASPAYLKAHGVPRRLEDLANHRLIHYVVTLGSKSTGFEYFDGTAYKTVPMKGAVTVNSVEAYEASCIAGLGIVQVPSVAVQHLIADGLLVEVLPDLRSEPMPVALVYAHRRNLPRRLRVFMDWMAQVMEKHVERSAQPPARA